MAKQEKTKTKENKKKHGIKISLKLNMWESKDYRVYKAYLTKMLMAMFGISLLNTITLIQTGNKIIIVMNLLIWLGSAAALLGSNKVSKIEIEEIKKNAEKRRKERKQKEELYKEKIIIGENYFCKKCEKWIPIKGEKEHEKGH